MANVEFKGGTYRITRAGLHAALTEMNCEMRNAILQLPYGTKRDQYNTDALEERYMAQSEYLRAAIDALPLED